MFHIITEYPHFFTARNLEWKKLLEPDKYKDIIIRSMRFLVEDNRAIIYGFVIMPNHIHLIWQMKAGIKRDNVLSGFLKFTAQRIKDNLDKFHPEILQQFKVKAKAKDRQYHPDNYQDWERNPRSVELWTEKTLIRKLNYLHENPVRAGLCKYPEEYKYSSVQLYKTGIDNWDFLTHLRD